MYKMCAKRKRNDDDDEKEKGKQHHQHLLFWQNIKAGDYCDVLDTKGIWLRGEVKKIDPNDILHISYLGFDESWDERIALFSERVAPVYSHLPALEVRDQKLTLFSHLQTSTELPEFHTLDFTYWNLEDSTLESFRSMVALKTHLNDQTSTGFMFTNCHLKTPEFINLIASSCGNIRILSFSRCIFSQNVLDRLALVLPNLNIDRFTFQASNSHLELGKVISHHPTLKRVCIDFRGVPFKNHYLFYQLFKNPKIDHLHYILGGSKLSLTTLCRDLSPLDGEVSTSLQSWVVKFDLQEDFRKGHPVNEIIKSFIYRMCNGVFKNLKMLYIEISEIDDQITEVLVDLSIGLVKCHPHLHAIRLCSVKPLAFYINNEQEAQLAEAIKNNSNIIATTFKPKNIQASIEKNRKRMMTSIRDAVLESITNIPYVLADLIAEYVALPATTISRQLDHI